MAPLGLLARLREYWPYGKAAEAPPPLSSGVAVLLSITFTLAYVVPFYLSPTTRPSRTILRDSPTVIKARVRSVLLSCLLCAIPAVYVLSGPGQLPYYETLHLLGLWPVSLPTIARAMALIVTLFAGPLFEHLVVEESWREYVADPARTISQLSSPIGFRNYIAGPFTEEFLFRSLLIPLNMLTPQVTKAVTGLAGTHARVVIYTTPLYFGVAHIHHLYEFRLQHPRVPFHFAVLQALFQLCFTTIFGWYAAFVFVRTGSLWACFLTHAFCNWMGLPRFWGRVKRRQPEKPKSFSVMKPVTPKAPVAMGPPEDEPGVRGYNAPPQPSKSFRAPLPGWDGIKRDAYDILGADGNGNGDGNATRGLGRARTASFTRTRSQQRANAEEGDLAWTVAYYVVLFAGMFGFYQCFWSLTQSLGQLAEV